MNKIFYECFETIFLYKYQRIRIYFKVHSILTKLLFREELFLKIKKLI
jgi:hypothetical protein